MGYITVELQEVIENLEFGDLPVQEVIHSLVAGCLEDVADATTLLDGLYKEWTKDTVPYDHYHDDVAKALALGWKIRDDAIPTYRGPDHGHYLDCAGWGDCFCGEYINPFGKL